MVGKASEITAICILHSISSNEVIVTIAKIGVLWRHRYTPFSWLQARFGRLTFMPTTRSWEWNIHVLGMRLVSIVKRPHVSKSGLWGFHGALRPSYLRGFRESCDGRLTTMIVPSQLVDDPAVRGIYASGPLKRRCRRLVLPTWRLTIFPGI